MEKIPKAKIEEIVIAALLHDIGKFIQRTRSNSFKSNDEENLCPFNKSKNYFTHKHVLYTDGYLSFLNKNLFFPKKINGDMINILASMHHNPSTAMQKIISIADHLSSGSDRSKTGIMENDNKFFEQPLRCIFDKINLNNDNISENYYSLNKLESNNVFPNNSIKSISANEYLELFEQFNIDMIKLKNYDYKNYIDVLDSLMKHYLWCIPSSTMSEPDVSLYDHSYTTAALAAVLYKYHEENDTLFDEKAISDYKDKKFLFISGDLSGIQNYIFDFNKSTYAAKILRARSFEIQAFAETTALYILNELGLPKFCRIMNAGGRFILLLPNTQNNKDKLKEIRQKVEKMCVDKYFGELTLNISEGIEKNGEEIQIKNAKRLFTEISKDTQKAKLKKLQSVLIHKSDHIISNEYDKFTSSQDLCPVCGKRVKFTDELCEFCNRLKDFGSKIPNSKYIYYKENEKNITNGLNFINNLSVDSSVNIKNNSFPNVINSFKSEYPTIYMPYYVPVNKDKEVLSFEELAEKSEGREHLAMFKADIDNLGMIFSIGIKKISISRYATLSRMLDFFFSGYLNRLIMSEFNNIYTVFSGGDDLCVIGPWTDIIKFSLKVQEEFKRFIGHNYSISISGGIALASKSLPIKNIAENAELYLDESKNKDEKKNKITIFNTTVSWKDFKELINLGDEINDYLKKDYISKGIIYRLLEYGERYKAVMRGDLSGKNALWHSQLKYDAARNIKDIKIRDIFLEFVIENIENIRLPVSYILYKNR